eukprot:CAMPEP_0119368330 /NCGR_PEP_ID=MMETSP1334-20130426/15003_1 /TAXON_ID=127549 /ORGANISM="Calcidiscus leptoporus, Strain RCC1130" /LENGTH=110 /DNA_ID=CAMNT_0007384945 /DNA_START=10 /DNA_END=342 /DNA_ORIENTATION=+
MEVPGVSVLGPKGVTFSQIATDYAVRAALEQSAASAGRAHFNWLDLKAISGPGGLSGSVFMADARPPPLSAASGEMWPTSQSVRQVGLASAALTVGLVLGRAWAAAAKIT